MKPIEHQIADAIRQANPEEYRDTPEAADAIAQTLLAQFDITPKVN